MIYTKLEAVSQRKIAKNWKLDFLDAIIFEIG